MEAIHWLAHFILAGIVGILALQLATSRRKGHRETVLPIKRELDDARERLRQIGRELSDALDQLEQIRALTDAEIRA